LKNKNVLQDELEGRKKEQIPDLGICPSMKRLKRVLFIYSLFDIGNNEAVFVIGFF